MTMRMKRIVKTIHKQEDLRVMAVFVIVSMVENNIKKDVLGIKMMIRMLIMKLRMNLKKI